QLDARNDLRVEAGIQLADFSEHAVDAASDESASARRFDVHVGSAGVDSRTQNQFEFADRRPILAAEAALRIPVEGTRNENAVHSAHTTKSFCRESKHPRRDLRFGTDSNADSHGFTIRVNTSLTISTSAGLNVAERLHVGTEAWLAAFCE